uniref:SH3 domain-containing protein n=1 Tax=Malurus cyaneus samueli TaxID=2593467 RepID=A0A8C5TJY9_9PASS
FAHRSGVSTYRGFGIPRPSPQDRGSSAVLSPSSLPKPWNGFWSPCHQSPPPRAPEDPRGPHEASPRCHRCRRAVRALCDHTGTAEGHLSFHKGDILELLSTVDEDWIRCCHGNTSGLVPVGYTSLIL